MTDGRLGALRRAVAWGLDAALALILVSVTAIAAVQMTLRYVASSAILWAEEVSVLLMVWFVALGVGRIWLADDHIAVPLLPDALPEGARRALLALFDACAIAAGVALVIAARPLVAIYGTIVLDTLPASAAWKYSALIGAGVTLAICAALRLALRLAGPGR